MRNKASFILEFIKKYWLAVLFSLVFVGLWYQIMFKGSFGDEQENMTAGWLILQGQVPYQDFFFHHMPLPFFISALLHPFAAPSFHVYRWFVLSFHLIIFWLLMLFLKRKHRFLVMVAYLLLALSSPFIGVFQFLADSIVTTSLGALAVLLFQEYLLRQSNQRGRLNFRQYFGILSVLGIITIYSSVAYAIALILIFVLSLVIFRQELKEALQDQQYFSYLKLAGAAIFSALLIPAYFLAHHAFEPFFWSTVTYNQKYYFATHLAEDELELKYGMLFRIVRQFIWWLERQGLIFFEATRIATTTVIKSGWALVSGSLNLSFSQLTTTIWMIFWPAAGQMETALAIAFIFISIYWLIKSWKLGLSFILLSLAFRARSNEIFHQSPFYFLVFLSLAAVLIEAISARKKILVLLSSLIFIYLVGVFGQNYLGYLKFDEPVIDNRLRSFSLKIEQLIEPQEKLLVVGGYPTYYLLSQRLSPTKYFYYHPWFTESERIRGGIIKAIQAGEPDLILFDDMRERIKPEYFDPELKQLIQSEYVLLPPELVPNVKIKTTDPFYGYVKCQDYPQLCSQAL